MKTSSKGKKPVNKKIIIAVAAAVAVIAVAVALLFHFNIIGSHNNNHQGETGALSIEYTFEPDDGGVMKIGDIIITEAEYEFFYRQSYSNLRNSVELAFKEFVTKKEGDSYVEGTDYYDQHFEAFLKENPNTFDFKKPIDAQPAFAKNDEDGQLSWAQYIHDDAVETMIDYRVRFEMARDMGLELTDDVRYQVYDHIEGLRTAVLGGGYPTLDEYLKILFGEACDEEFFKNELIREYMATKYDSQIRNKLMSGYKSSDIKAIYEADYKEYDFADLYVYEVEGADAKKTAEAILNETIDTTSFAQAIVKNIGEGANYQAFPGVPKYYVDNYYSEQLSQWAFDKARQQGDKAVFETQKGYTVVFVGVPVYSKGECISYREIVLNKTDENGKLLEGEALEAVNKNAEDILKRWKKGDKTEDSFTYFALSESKGSTAPSGGLNSGIVANEMTDEAIKNWCISEERKSGDVEIVETESAFVIVYFMSGYDNYWEYSIRNEKANTAATDKLENAKKEDYKLYFDSEAMNEVDQNLMDNISELYLGIVKK